MDDYIKRENAKRAVWGCARDTGIDEAPFEYAEGLLEDVPSADVAPVRHGHWEPYSIEPEVYDIAGVKSWAKKYRCSECRFLHTVIEDFGIYTFCPNCGAKMDGGGTDGTDDR